MKRLIGMLLCAALCFLHGPVQARVYNQAELDAMLAPIALYPDPLLSQILLAATYPQDVAEAAAWSRANPGLAGDDAVRAVEDQPWDPSVKALVAFPEILSRMGDSPQWTGDLGQAFLEQEPYVMDTVQALRRRAQAAGNLQSNDQYTVQQYGSTIAVQPVQPQVVYVPYYDPYVVYGPWWWPAYQPVFWQPWVPHPVFVSQAFFFVRPDWHRRHIRVIQPSPQMRAFVRVPEANRQPIVSSTPQIRRDERRQVEFRRPPQQSEFRRPPQQAPAMREPRAQMPAAPGFTPRMKRRQTARAEPPRPATGAQRPGPIMQYPGNPMQRPGNVMQYPRQMVQHPGPVVQRPMSGGGQHLWNGGGGSPRMEVRGGGRRS